MSVQGAGVFDGIVDFGAGVMIGVPNAGDLSTDPTPRQFGVLQEVSVDFSADQVELHGAYKYPVDVASAKNKVQIKAKFAAIDGRALSDLWLGTDPSAGMTRFLVGSFAETGTVPAMTTFTIQVTNHTVYDEDYGVAFADGTSLKKNHTGTPAAAGQYGVVPSTGTYTFHSGDANKAVLISYSYTDSSNGITVVGANQLMGSGPRFEMLLWNKYRNKELGVRLHQCISSKFSLPRKNTAHAVSDFEGQAFANSAGSVYTIFQDTHE